jgi:predicted MFS family arabinose efflux permease
VTAPSTDRERRQGLQRRLLWVLATATFLIFFQAFMVAPLIPTLSGDFGTSPQRIGLVVPAYMVAYGVATLVYGLGSDRWGRRRLMVGSLSAFVVFTAGTATAQTATQLIVWRLATGSGAAAVIPLALSLIGATYPFDKRGQPLGWLFAAMAGGMAFGSSLGALAEPFLGWRGLFITVAAVTAVVLWLLAAERDQLGAARPDAVVSPTQMLAGFRKLLSSSRARATYSFVALNSIFHSGVFTWFGLYFSRRYDLGEIGIAIAIIGYGVPGFLLGPAIGRAADGHGRHRILPIGLAVGALGAAALIPRTGVIIGAIAVLIVSLGYDLTQPLLAGIVTDIGGPQAAGRAMGLNVFILFTGFGLGAFIFGELLTLGFGPALAVFASGQLLLAALGLWLFRSERPRHASRAEPSG